MTAIDPPTMALPRRLLFLTAIALLASVPARASATPEISGTLKTWHTVELTFAGPPASEEGDPNPFLDYRLEAVFQGPSGQRYAVPGFFAADGRAADSSAVAGDRWRVRFAPDQPGRWTWRVSFRRGPQIALATGPDAGQPAGPDGAEGVFEIAPSDKSAPDLRARGRLRYVGERYFRFAGSGERFLKGGSNSPENFLAYAGFDGTYDTRAGADDQGDDVGLFLHHYAPHQGDWQAGDPTWGNGRGKGIIGALNYLSSRGVNSLASITYNLDGGDGGDVWPWSRADTRRRFDVSKLAQWAIVFEHMAAKGIVLHLLTQEEENDQALGGLGLKRRVYYRELIARFAHLPGLIWNLGEENTNSPAERQAFAAAIRALDPYDHPVVVHTFPDQHEAVYGPLLGGTAIDGPSFQTAGDDGFVLTRDWIGRARAAGRPWVVMIDEQLGWRLGVRTDADDPGRERARTKILWPHLIAGGAGIEWYAGFQGPQNDLDLEDFRAYERLWDQTRRARTFFERYLPFWAMTAHDDLADRGLVLAKEGQVYAVYLPDGGTTELRLPQGRYRVRWYDPREDGDLRGGVIIEGPGQGPIGEPPGPGDWVALVERL